MIRLWPSAEPGVFEGEVNAATIGLHNIRVTADTGATVDAVLVVDRGHGGDVVRGSTIFRR